MVERHPHRMYVGGSIPPAWVTEDISMKIIDKIVNEKLAEMVQYVKENGIVLPKSIKEQCRKAGYEV